ncbi:MAG: DUF1697 domain-containing protein [Myxococcota bacterium]|nr:DUF1697 domain-containing protein [Myxococcota bacterium]
MRQQTARVALLRGINVGGRNALPMKELAAMFVAAGCADVRTYIQSGNVVFHAAPAIARRVPGVIAKAIEDAFGFRTPVITRSAAELADIVASNPFLARGADAGALHVAFLDDEPSAAQLAALDPERGAPDDLFEAGGREIYLCCPSGLARTKLTNAYFDSKLATTSTFRNWRTVLQLLEMTSAR